MKITLDIPKEFERHFNNDRFKDSIERLKGDAGTFCLAGKYEIELCEILIESLRNAEIISSEYKPRLTAKWDINCDGYYPYCTNCGNEPQVKELTKFCPKCGALMLNHRVDKQ